MRKGATTGSLPSNTATFIVALRNEKGSYNSNRDWLVGLGIVALRNEKGSYNLIAQRIKEVFIVALRNEKGSYN